MCDRKCAHVIAHSHRHRVVDLLRQAKVRSVLLVWDRFVVCCFQRCLTLPSPVVALSLMLLPLNGHSNGFVYGLARVLPGQVVYHHNLRVAIRNFRSTAWESTEFRIFLISMLCGHDSLPGWHIVQAHRPSFIARSSYTYAVLSSWPVTVQAKSVGTLLSVVLV